MKREQTLSKLEVGQTKKKKKTKEYKINVL